MSVDPRLSRFALQAVARDWLWDAADGLGGPFHRLAGCMRWPAFSADKADAARTVDVLWDGASRAYFQGLQTRGMALIDPVCSGVVYDVRRAEVAQALEWARGSGYRVFFVTLTARHSKSMDLASLLDALSGAVRRVYAGKRFQGLKRSFGYLGAIKGLEITNGRHGWHPHFHLLWFAKRGTAAELSAFVDGAWGAALRAEGLSGLRGIRAVVKDSSLSAEDYMTKFGRDRNSWDLDAELTLWSRKAGDHGGATPWDLLRAGLREIPAEVVGTPRERVYLEIQARCRHLFREYAAAVRGVHGLRWSAGLKARVGVVDRSDDEAAAGASNTLELVMLARLSLAQWRLVLRHDLRAELLAVAGTGDYAALVELLARIGVLLPPAWSGSAAAPWLEASG